MAAAELRFNIALSEYQQTQKSYVESKKKVKEEFQEAKDSGYISDSDTMGNWIVQNQPAFMAQHQKLCAAAGQLQAAAEGKWGSDSEEELKNLGLSRTDIAAQTIGPGHSVILPSVGKVEF